MSRCLICVLSTRIGLNESHIEYLLLGVTHNDELKALGMWKTPTLLRKGSGPAISYSQIPHGRHGIVSDNLPWLNSRLS
jgi:hypothetical protein